MRKIIAKSHRSRRVRCASGPTFMPSIARQSEIKDGVRLDAAYAMIKVRLEY